MAPSRPPRKPRATYEDVLAAPKNKVAEILNGQLVLSPRPALPHACATSAMGGLFFDFHGEEGRGGRGNGPGGWWILDEPELHFGDDVLVPDLAGWRVERLPRVPDDPWLSLAPDWVCETASPSTVVYDRTVKADIYCREGVAWMWIVDPVARLLEVFRRVEFPEASGEHRWLRIDALGDESAYGDEPEPGGSAPSPSVLMVQPEPFAALPFDLSLLWR